MFFNTTTKDGYTSEIAAWLALSTGGENIGQDVGDGSGYVTIDLTIYSMPYCLCDSTLHPSLHLSHATFDTSEPGYIQIPSVDDAH